MLALEICLLAPFSGGLVDGFERTTSIHSRRRFLVREMYAKPLFDSV